MTVGAAFQAKGDEPEWRLIYSRLLDTAEFGDVITYDDLDSALGRPFRDNRAPLYRARTEMGDTRRRWLEPVPGVGYRIIEASEHLQAAAKRKRRAQRQLRQMVHIGEVTDLTRLTPEQLATFDSQTRFNRLAYMALMSHERRLRRIEDVLRADGKL